MAENDSWAKFPPQSSSEIEDDDWADFGGFETATPVTDSQATANTSGLISWAALSTTPQATTDTPSQPVASSVEPSPWTMPVQPENEDLSKEVFEQVSATPSDCETNSLETSTDRNLQEQLSNLTNELRQQRNESEKATKLVDDLKTKIAATDQENIKFKKDLEDMLDKNQILEIESKETKDMLSMQKQSYLELQEKHDKQIEDIRQAGHDALAIIIEEYKELCKQAVLEQQEKNQAEVHLFMENERQKFKETVLQQQESFEKSLSEERSSNEERIKNVLQAEQEKHKLLLESSVSKAQEDLKAEIRTTVQKSIEDGKESVKIAVTKERELHQKTIENMEKVLHEERERFKILLEDALSQERTQSKIAIEETLAEQSQKSKDIVNISVEETKTAMANYTKQKLEAASKAQQKQLVAIDLFLESARAQIKSLMDSEPTS